MLVVKRYLNLNIFKFLVCSRPNTGKVFISLIIMKISVVVITFVPQITATKTTELVGGKARAKSQILALRLSSPVTDIKCVGMLSNILCPKGC